jgi:hypothetical protein
MCYTYKILIRGFLTRLDVRTLRLQMLQEITEVKKEPTFIRKTNLLTKHEYFM